MKTALLSMAVMMMTQTAFAMNDCQKQSLSVLQKNDQHGYRVYTKLDHEDKNKFLRVLTCEKVMILELPFAVRGAILNLSQDGTNLSLSGKNMNSLVLPQASLKPAAIVDQLDINDPIVKFYLLEQSQSNSKNDFSRLLEVLNSYTHALQSAVNLHALLPGASSTHHRNGLATVMNIVKIYINRVATTEAATFRILNLPENAQILRTMWADAENALKASCAPNKFGLGTNDAAVLAQLYSPDTMGGLVHILDYTPTISVQCRNASR